MVYGVCRLVLRDPSEAEDAAQQVFLSAYRGLLAGQEPRDPSAWLGTIARNECRTRLRGRSTEPLTLLTTPAGDETQREVARRAEVEALCTALSDLPGQQRDAIVLREFYGLSYSEVAAALGLSGAAVESLIFRSRRRLQEQLRPLRAALGVLTIPVTLRDSLAQALPGFGASGAAAGAGTLASLGSAPVAAKVAAATLALGTAGTVAGMERESHQGPPASRAAVADRAPVARPAPLRLSGQSRPTERAEPEQEHGSHELARGRDGGGRDSRRGSSGPGGGEVEHRTTTVSGEGPSSGSGGGGSSGSGSGQSVRQTASGDGHEDGGISGGSGTSGRDGGGSGASGGDGGDAGLGGSSGPGG